LNVELLGQVLTQTNLFNGYKAGGLRFKLGTVPKYVLNVPMFVLSQPQAWLIIIAPTGQQ